MKRSPVVHLLVALGGLVLLVGGLALLGIGARISAAVLSSAASMGRGVNPLALGPGLGLGLLGLVLLLLVVLSGLLSSAGMLMGLVVGASCLVLQAWVWPGNLLDIVEGSGRVPPGSVDAYAYGVADFLAFTIAGLGCVLFLQRHSSRGAPRPVRFGAVLGHVVGIVLLPVLLAMLGLLYIYAAQAARMDQNPFSLTGRTFKTGLIAVVLILVLLLSRWSPAAPILPGLALIGMGVVGLIPRGFTAIVDVFDQEFADMTAQHRPDWFC
jgi:hypothetical protein